MALASLWAVFNIVSPQTTLDPGILASGADRYCRNERRVWDIPSGPTGVETPSRFCKETFKTRFNCCFVMVLRMTGKAEDPTLNSAIFAPRH